MPTQEVTELLRAWGRGEESAFAELVPIVHAELKSLAHRYMGRERRGHPLQTTALVNEAYVRLVDCARMRWQDRTHFLAMSARLMRRILVDIARSRDYQKRGGGVREITLKEGLTSAGQGCTDFMKLNEALTALEKVDPRKSQVVEMKFFGGLTAEEIAEVLNVSPQTVMRDWKLARAWLRHEMKCDNRES